MSAHFATVAGARLSLAHDGAASSNAWNSAFFCVDEGREALSRGNVDAALMWGEKAAQYVWGFQRPTGW